MLLMCRVGEARVPGPDVESTWSLGICNPSGLYGKQAILTQIKADVLAISESHLSKTGARQLTTSLRSLRSPFKHMLTGAPMAPRCVLQSASHTLAT